MTATNHKVVHIVDKTANKVLSKAQKLFNNLIKKIELQKKLMLEWQNTLPSVQQRVNSEYVPLVNSFNDCRIEWLHLLDSAYDNKAFNKTDKKKLRHILDELTYELVFDHGKEELKHLYNKYAEDGDYDTEKEMFDGTVESMMKSMIEDVLGVDMGDDFDLSSPEKMQAALQEKLLEKENQKPQSKQRKKTAKQLEKEARQQQEEVNISKSIQSVYRKLAATLHPDREPDEQERERKTKLMQKVNAAYAKKDLLQLLELQLEIEQIDQSHLNNIAEDRLKHFNKILQDQLNELSQEIEDLEDMFKLQLALPPFVKINPKMVITNLERDIKGLKNDIKRSQTDIKTAQNPAALKIWLKTYKIPKVDNDPFDFFY